jgi:hypothetical protein
LPPSASFTFAGLVPRKDANLEQLAVSEILIARSIISKAGGLPHAQLIRRNKARYVYRFADLSFLYSFHSCSLITGSASRSAASRI